MSLVDVEWEHAERLLELDIIRQIEDRLTEAKASALRCQLLLLPRHMTSRVGQDVGAASADEPCGLRGAAIALYVEGGDGLTCVGRVFPDPCVTPTFELSVIFRTDRGAAWTALLSIFDRHKVLKLRPEYRLVKRKLYSSASPVIHEFT